MSYKIQLVSDDGKTVYGTGSCRVDKIASGNRINQPMLKAELIVRTPHGEFRGYWNALPFSGSDAAQRSLETLLASGTITQAQFTDLSKGIKK